MVQLCWKLLECGGETSNKQILERWFLLPRGSAFTHLGFPLDYEFFCDWEHTLPNLHIQSLETNIRYMRNLISDVLNNFWYL